MAIPRWPAARLTYGLTQSAGQRPLRFSKETPMANWIIAAFQRTKVLRDPLFDIQLKVSRLDQEP